VGSGYPMASSYSNHDGLGRMPPDMQHDQDDAFKMNQIGTASLGCRW
jgi:hypothetical protein